MTNVGGVVQRIKRAIVPRDYNVCEENEDGAHGPLEANYDPEIAGTHVSVMCMSCYLTTGWPIDEFEGRLDWN